MPDTTRVARGIALKIYLPDSSTTDIIGITLPVFFVRTNRATDPKQMDAEKHLFAYSVFYLFALFAVLVADRFLAW